MTGVDGTPDPCWRPMVLTAFQTEVPRSRKRAVAYTEPAPACWSKKRSNEESLAGTPGML